MVDHRYPYAAYSTHLHYDVAEIGPLHQAIYGDDRGRRQDQSNVAVD